MVQTKRQFTGIFLFKMHLNITYPIIFLCLNTFALSKWVKVWSDEFDGNSLDNNKWLSVGDKIKSTHFHV